MEEEVDGFVIILEMSQVCSPLLLYPSVYLCDGYGSLKGVRTA